MEWLAGQGAQIYVPVGHSPDVDLVALLDGRLLRVEVKTGTLSDSRAMERAHLRPGAAIRAGTASSSTSIEIVATTCSSTSETVGAGSSPPPRFGVDQA